MQIKTTTTFGDDHGRQWWIGVDKFSGKAKLVVSGGAGTSTRYDLDNATRLALVKALSGEGD